MIARQAHNQRAALACFRHAAHHIRRPSAGGNADDAVMLIHIQSRYIASAHLGVVFRAFNRVGERKLAARDDADDQFRRNIEGGRTLGSVQHTQPARRACANVNQAPACLYPFGDVVDRLRDLR